MQCFQKLGCRNICWSSSPDDSCNLINRYAASQRPCRKIEFVTRTIARSFLHRGTFFTCRWHFQSAHAYRAILKGAYCVVFVFTLAHQVSSLPFAIALFLFVFSFAALYHPKQIAFKSLRHRHKSQRIPHHVDAVATYSVSLNWRRWFPENTDIFHNFALVTHTMARSGLHGIQRCSCMLAQRGFRGCDWTRISSHTRTCSCFSNHDLVIRLECTLVGDSFYRVSRLQLDCSYISNHRDRYVSIIIRFCWVGFVGFADPLRSRVVRDICGGLNTQTSPMGASNNTWVFLYPLLPHFLCFALLSYCENRAVLGYYSFLSNLPLWTLRTPASIFSLVPFNAMMRFGLHGITQL